jgi:hypothetical protein
MVVLLEGQEREPIGVLVVALPQAVAEEQQRPDDEQQADEDLQD